MNWRFGEVIERKSEPDSSQHQQQKQQTAFTETSITVFFVERLDGGTRVRQLAAEMRACTTSLWFAVARSSSRTADCWEEGGLVELVYERRQRLAFHRIVVHVKVCKKVLQSVTLQSLRCSFCPSAVSRRDGGYSAEQLGRNLSPYVCVYVTTLQRCGCGSVLFKRTCLKL